MAKIELPSTASRRCVDAAVRAVDGGGVRLRLHVKPKSRPERLDDDGDELLLRVSAPPVEGKANERVIELIAARLGVPRRQVRLVRGEAGRHKELEIDGLALEAVAAGLCGP